MVVLEAGDKRVPSVFVRKASKVLSLVKVMTELRLLLAEELGAVNTTAWNQEPLCLHISGPPESPCCSANTSVQMLSLDDEFPQFTTEV